MMGNVHHASVSHFVFRMLMIKMRDNGMYFKILFVYVKPTVPDPMPIHFGDIDLQGETLSPMRLAHKIMKLVQSLPKRVQQ